MPGHPDGQNYAIWRGPDFLANPTFPLSASNPLSVSGQITNYASLVINLGINNPGGVSFVINWFTDSTLSVPLTSDGFVLPNGFSATMILPALGNFVRVDVTTPDVGATNSGISIYPTNTPTQHPSFQSITQRIVNVSQSIPLSTTITVNFPFIAAGQAHLYAQDLASSTKLGIQVAELTKSGAVNGVIHQVLAPFVISEADFAVTAVPMALRLINSDAAAAHSISYHFAVNSSV